MSSGMEAFSKLSPSEYSGRFIQLNEFLARIQLEMLDKSDERRAGLKSTEEIENYSELMRRTFIEKFGGIPERDCPLDAKTVRVIDMGDFIIENVVFSPRKNVYATASLYIPGNLEKPAPAVLFLCGHLNDGRMGDIFQEVCQVLVNAGLVVFALDPVGQGERKNFYDRETGEYAIKNAVTDHDFCGIPSLCTGRFIEGYFINDQFAAVDYMLTRNEIDPKCIGVTGCSGGGLQSLCVMACDDRIAAAAPAAFTSTRREILYTCQSQDSEQIWPGCASYGFDHFEPYIIFAPKPVMMLTVSSDFFPIEGAYEVYDELKRIYALYGKEVNVNIFELNSCHDYPVPLAEKAADFFCEVFGAERRKGKGIKTLAVEDMQMTHSGNVLGDFKDAVAVPDETSALAKKLKENRKSEKRREWLTEKVFNNRIPSAPVLRMADAKRSTYLQNYTGKSAMWWVQKRLAAYGVLISKGRNEAVPDIPVVIALWDNGTKAIEKHEKWIESTCDLGKQVLVVDLPGVGNIEQAKLWGWSAYREGYGTMYKMCCDLMYMGDSMAAMQTYHVLCTADMIRDVLGIKDISFYCAEQEGVYGIMAGYLGGFDREYSKDLLCSVENQILSERPMKYDNTLSYLLPGMLEYFDYDELMN